MSNRGIEVLEDTVLCQFLGADGVKELRSKVIDMIVEEIRTQLESSTYYIISPDDIATDIYGGVIEDIKKEIMEEYKEKIKAAVDKKMMGMGI